jgi:hypothetical protein
MNATHISDIQAQSRQTLDRVLDLTLRQGEPVVVVDSPPGAGKTWLVESVVATAVQYAQLRVAVVAPRTEQTYDFLRRLIANFDPMQVQVLKSSRRELPPDLATHPRIRQATPRADELLDGPGVVVGTVDKFVYSVPNFGHRPFSLLICDEAYQTMYGDMAPLFQLAGQTLLVGDPGQLPPLVQVDTKRFDAAPHRVHWATPREMLRRFPGIPVVKLPASRRLPQDTVSLVQPAFYPSLPFTATATDDERRLRLSPARHDDAIDQALDLLAAGASMVSVTLPVTRLPASEVDEDVAAVMAECGQRLLDRRAEWIGKRRLTACDIGCADAHVASGAAVRRHLRARSIKTEELIVDTPELWQGLERPLMIVKHPLSGKSRLSSFDLEPGRWCVMLSRHQLGCIIVGRGNIGAALERHQHDCASRSLGMADEQWHGWRAHQTLWTQLLHSGAVVELTREAESHLVT